MKDINEFSTIGIFNKNDIKGNLPLSKFEFDRIKIYLVNSYIQQCECYNTETKKLRVFRRIIKGNSEYAEWKEVKEWYEM